MQFTINIDESNRDGLIGAFGLVDMNGYPLPEAEQDQAVKDRAVAYLVKKLDQYYLSQYIKTAELPEIIIT